MTPTHRLIVAALVSVAVAHVGAQKVSLTESDVKDALAIGHKQKGKHQGLILRDSGQTWAVAMSSGGSAPSSGFWVEAFTPTTWVRQEASRAAKEYRTLEASAVGPELLEPVLRLIVHPDTPNTVTKQGMAGTSSVSHVVLRDESRKIVIQPIWKEPFSEEVKNAMGGSASFQGLNAKFPIEALREIRGPKGDREFFITVIGESGEEKNFKVKSKHFKELP